jgi:CubicO group peptidase (beta-lactamase class C family)
MTGMLNQEGGPMSSTTIRRWLAGAGFGFVGLLLAAAVWLWLDARVQALPSDAAIGSILEERVAAGFGTAIIVGILDGGARRFVARDDGTEGPISQDTRFEIASITKVWTTSLMAVMAEAGGLSFDGAAVSLWSANPPRLPERGGRPVTLADLGAHTAGLPKMPDDLVSIDPRDPEAGYTSERLDAFLLRYEAPAGDFGYRYSNVGFAVLGQALAERGGRPYGDLLREQVLVPLGMGSSGLVGDPGAVVSVGGHDDQMALVPPFSAGVFSPAGGGVSTANDLLTFADAYLGHGESMIVKAVARVTEFSVIDGPSGKPLGLGWDFAQLGRRTILVKDGSAAGYTAFLAIDRRANRAVVVLSNGQGAVSDIASHILDKRNPVRHFGLPIEVDAATLESVVDTYGGKDTGPVVFTRVEDRLYVQFGGLPAPIRLFPETPARFVAHAFDGAITFQDPAAGLAMEIDALVNGQAIRLRRH